ncbi:MAG TPA: Ku protein [Acidimicrobiales bacterium]|jgi:DNA end-binding protein Ku|nr:Ku protein [Acidimicrobiales bacterium]
MPPRTAWSGSLSFGLVNVPIGLYPATADKSIHFNQFEEGTSDRIRYKKVNERTNEEVPAHRIVRGVDVGGGEYVMVNDEELEASEPERSHEIQVTGFIDLDEIDPLYFRTSYYVAPTPGGPDKAYALLRTAMQRSGKVAVASLIMRNKEFLVAIRPAGDGLILETLYFADEIREPSRDLPALPADDAVSDRELEVADLLIDAMTMEWDPAQYHDTHQQALRDLIERKQEGETITTGDRTPRAPVVDLMAALEASMTSTRQGRPAAGGRSKARSGQPAAKRTPAKRSGPARASGQSAAKGSTEKAPARKATAAKSTGKKATAKTGAPAKKATKKAGPRALRRAS